MERMPSAYGEFDLVTMIGVLQKGGVPLGAALKSVAGRLREGGKVAEIPNQPVVLFDGVCNLCDKTVQFIIDRDRSETFLFASLQSAAGRRILEAVGFPVERFDTMVLVEGGRAYTKSSAALRIVRRLSGLWPLVYGFVLVPKAIRDMAYTTVSRNRYKWFGVRDECRIPTPELKSRFLET